MLGEEEATETNEFEKVDAVLCTLIGNKTRKSCKMSIDDAKHSRSYRWSGVLVEALGQD
ncbi:hypothetical protein Gohar_003709 [Gossypium harknessii]|uniref:Uncharacterized protein n=1 Tax=Gossypium harknessii TaxID=34285 RepID=A0A7J9IFN0_9ROSI|nr:hypothetical protein [Gossypium harknessii]